MAEETPQNVADSIPTRLDWQANHNMIERAFFDLLKKNKSVPTQSEIAEVCGLTRDTVGRHLKNFDFESLFASFRAGNSRVLLGLMNRAMKGNAPDVKLFFQLVNQWSEKQQHEINHNVSVDLSKLTDEELRAYAIKLASRVGAGDSGAESQEVEG